MSFKIKIIFIFLKNLEREEKIHMFYFGFENISSKLGALTCDFLFSLSILSMKGFGNTATTLYSFISLHAIMLQ